MKNLPQWWEYKKIEDLADELPNAIVDGPFGSNLLTSDYVKEGIPVLQGANITGNILNLNNIRYISERKAKELKRSLVKIGDLVLVKIGSIGYAAVVDYLGGHQHAIIPANLLKASFNSNKVNVRYVLHYLTSEMGYKLLNDIAGKTAQPAISLGRFKNTYIPTPPLPEQRRIAEILDTVDETIRKTEQIINKLKSIKAGLLYNLLTRGIDENGNLRDPEKNPEEFKSVNGILVPAKWEKRKMDDIFSLEYGTGLKSGQRIGDDYPVYGSNGEIGRHNNYLVKGPGIIVGRKGSVGKIIWSDENFWPIDTTYYVIPTEDCDFRWLYWRLYSLALNKLDTSTGVPGLNRNDVYNIKEHIPPLNEQRNISLKLDLIESKIINELTYSDKLQKIKKGLMSDLLTGKVRVNADKELVV